MAECAICQHPKIQAIDAALASGRAPNLIRSQYRLEPHMFHDHLIHKGLRSADRVLEMAPEPDRNHLPTGHLRETTTVAEDENPANPEPAPVSSTVVDERTLDHYPPGHLRALLPQTEERPFGRFKQLWQEAHETDRLRILQWLQEQLQADDMGLP